ncbi:RNA-binding protein 34 [Strongyloides ratti]|uniref:RNA-binding protein 34 n=1 Tax=Strongyloides ratti TaxID=34506 RepID=A0A090KYI2_STRRB|nr:RNA-binding protein 34 [Strongyloides ratti]CEF62501.1 RNA-binding protein 34 [Strongyloides ratti]
MTSKYRPGNLAAALFGASNNNEEESSSSSDEESGPVTAAEKMVITHTRAEEQRKEEKHKEREEHKKKIQQKLDTVKQRDDECPRTLYVGNAPLNTTRDKIRNIFHHFGKVHSVRMRNVLPQNEKMSRRAAAQTGKFSELQKSLTFYVKYEKEESVGAALAAGKHEIDGRQLIVTSANDIKYDPKCSVFVGNLHLKITEDDLIKHFSPVVDVNAVRVVRDRNSHEGIGIAFVRLSDPTLLKKALTLNGSQLLGREIRVTKIAKKKNRSANNGRQGKKFNKGDRKDGKNNKHSGVLPRSKNINKKFKKRTDKKDNKKTIMS